MLETVLGRISRELEDHLLRVRDAVFSRASESPRWGCSMRSGRRCALTKAERLMLANPGPRPETGVDGVDQLLACAGVSCISSERMC